MENVKSQSNILQIYAQEFEHQDAYIVGNKEALLKLRNAIDEAIATEESSIELFCADGEGYNLIILNKNKLMDLMLPYNNSHLNSWNGKSPYDLCKNYKKLIIK